MSGLSVDLRCTLGVLSRDALIGFRGLMLSRCPNVHDPGIQQEPDALRCHALHFVAIRTEAARPIMRAATGFSADAYRGQLRDQGLQGMPG